MSLRDLAVAQHLEARGGTLEQAGHGAADQVGHQQAGRVPQVFLAARGVGGAAGQCVGHAGVERRAVRRVERLADQPLQLGRDGDDGWWLS